MCLINSFCVETQFSNAEDVCYSYNHVVQREHFLVILKRMLQNGKFQRIVIPMRKRQYIFCHIILDCELQENYAADNERDNIIVYKKYNLALSLESKYFLCNVLL